MINNRIKDKILAALHTRYDSWSGFQDPNFVADETEYKRRIAANAQKLIAKPQLESLLEQRQWDAFLEQFELAGQKSVNLLYRSTPKTGDLRLLYDPRIEGELRAEFCTSLFDLVYGSGSPVERLGSFVTFLNQKQLKPYWTFPTYYLFVTDPAQNILVKPLTLHNFFRFIEAEDLWSRETTAAGYQTILDTARELWQVLEAFGPTDMVDIQSIIYVCAEALQAQQENTAPLQPVPPQIEDAPLLAAPFDRIFSSYAEAELAFDLMKMVLEQLGVQDAKNPIFAVTIPKKGGGNALRLNYGNWLLTSFEGQTEFLLAIKEGLPELQEYPAYGSFAICAPAIALRRFPMQQLGNANTTYANAMAESFPVIREFFSRRRECLFHQHNRSEIAAAIFAPELRRALLTGKTVLPPLPESDGCFGMDSFELLAELHSKPTFQFYQEHQDELHELVVEPFQRIFRRVAERLPASICAVMETEKRIFSIFPKNDFGRGGVWAHYWGAFYPKGSRRSRDAQLSMWINYALFEHGFYIGDYGSAQRQRFIRNCALHRPVLEPLLTSIVGDEVRFGDRETLVQQPDGMFTYADGTSPGWGDFLQDPVRFRCDVSYFVTPEQLEQMTEEELAEKVLDGCRRLFPLVLLSTLDDPMPALEEYVTLEFGEEVDDDDGEIEPIVQPELPLSTIAQQTGFAEAELARWVKAIQRKKQAIFYGPPGTGKTFIARKLAEHLIGGGDGFWELVQFHPAYAYEDFIQGIRPQPMAGGGLDYPVVRGRFLEFCRKAAQCDGDCVLIIDEINRANLARVFGELMYLLEYRDQKIPLAASELRFRIPDNVYLIGTMNTADRSIALVDHALRRRFAFIKLEPNYDALAAYHRNTNTGYDATALIEVLKEVNQQIGDAHYHVGISFFLNDQLSEELEDIWRMEIEPYLEEYFFDNRERMRKYRWSEVARRLLTESSPHA